MKYYTRIGEREWEIEFEREDGKLLAKGGGKQSITALMPGVVVDVMVAVGDVVEEGQTLVILEAMKMQNPIQAEAPGKVSRLLAEKGAVVAGGALLVELESATD